MRIHVDQLTRFCLVGGSGVLIDMAVLYVLADANCFGWDVMVSKICAATTALIHNFLWNELYTFRTGARTRGAMEMLRRFGSFTAICGVGIIISALLLSLFHQILGWDVHWANLGAIGLTTCWNYTLNARFSWPATAGENLR